MNGAIAEPDRMSRGRRGGAVQQGLRAVVLPSCNPAAAVAQYPTMSE